MIDEIDRSLERWFRAAVPLPPGEAEVKFEQPEKGWDARRSTPMVNIFLYSVNKSFDRAMNGSRIVKRPDGGLARQQIVPVVEARYLISVWGGGPALEHELLGRLVNLLASSLGIPEDHQSDSLRSSSPQVTTSLAPDTVTSLTHLWSGLGVPPRPAIQLLIHSPMGLPTSVPVPDPPKALELGFARPEALAAFAPRRRSLSTRATTSRDGAPRATVVIEDSGRDKAMRREGFGE
ncbi:MAG: hypothetical protein ACI867_000052 [Glaciecola sp.]